MIQSSEPGGSICANLRGDLPTYLTYAAWLVSLVAMTGSLYFSEIMDLPPCVLCWYQRIAMYPLTAVIAVAIARRDRGVSLYVLPIALVGLTIAIYHNLLYYDVISESITSCQLGISCTARQIEWLGFITIPLLSLTAFTTITTLMSAHLLTGGNAEEEGFAE